MVLIIIIPSVSSSHDALTIYSTSGEKTSGSNSSTTSSTTQPFESVIGEIIGRSKKLIALGSKNIEFVMDQNYVR